MVGGGVEQRFLPAQSVEEAVGRIYSLTGATPSRSRGEKRAIVALRDALGLDIDVSRTSELMSQQIAAALDVEWRQEYCDRNRVNLTGLNALLRGASNAYARGALRRLHEQTPTFLVGPKWEGFEPARSKIEAVNRISALTGSGAEWLGPGSKEHKRVLINLAKALTPEIDTRLSKTKLGAALASSLDAPWSDDCESTGETIQLTGLNTLLAGAERRLGKLGADPVMLLGSPEDEGLALCSALVDAWRTSEGADGGRRVLWDGRQCIRWMVENGVANGPNQNEWQGFYWEARGRAILNSAFSPNPDPPRVTFGSTTFDYSLRYVWDLKAHTAFQRLPSSGSLSSGRPEAILNDRAAMDDCIAHQGLGFLIVSGVAVMDDDGEFVRWHRDFKEAGGVRTRSGNSKRSRMRKSAFEPQQVEAYFFHNTDEIDAALASGEVMIVHQGRQAPRRAGEPGVPRPTKYGIRLAARPTRHRVASLAWVA